MGRPRSPEEKLKLTINLAVSTKARLELFLYSSLEDRVPYGELSKFIDAAIVEKLDRVERDEKQLGVV